jgi:hypothetical protein
MSLSSPTSAGRPARLRFGAGARATEELLHGDLGRVLGGLTPETLDRQILLVVPSRCLRTHLLARIVERQGRALAGLSCTTLFGLARGLVEQHDGPPNLHDELGVLLARRFAAREPSLQKSLGHLREGFRSVDSSVRDLLEAGLEPAHVEALDEALEVDGATSEASREEIERARALVRVAGRTAKVLEAMGVLGTPALMRRAAEIVREDRREQSGASQLLVYGFSDAIGVATDLLLALLDRHRGTLYLDQPPDPADPDRPDAGNRFSRRFAERMADLARPDEVVAASPDRPRLSVFQAIGGEAEAREVAARCRALLDGGARPETIAIVARRLEQHRTPLRTHLGRLGVPFSSAGAPGPLGPSGRRARALIGLLDRGPSVPVERWLEAREEPLPQISNFDLHLALSTVGAGRLEEVGDRPYDAVARNGSYALPVRRGFAADEQEVTARRRQVPISALKRAAEAATRLCAHFASWRSQNHLAAHAEGLRHLLGRELAWRPSGELSRRVVSILDALTHGLPPDFELDFDEFVDLLRSPLDSVGLTAFGGRGGGVRVLDAIEARGLTFEHLFVVGLNRGVFPRVVNEDPLLPDSLRAVLSRHGFGVLQDLPQKLSGYDEERYLFSQLLAAGNRITLSWQDVDEDNHQQTASPLVERLRWSPGEQLEGWQHPETARPLYSASTAQREEPGWRHRPAHEAAVVAGIYGNRTHFGKVLPVAIAESAAPGARAPTGLHTARLRILDEMDPQRGIPGGERTRAELGPYFGFVGPIAPGDPRQRNRLFVTTLEGLAACSWRAFLERLLHLQPIPDPLEALPAIEPLYTGNLVHRVLERIVLNGIGRGVSELESARELSTPVVWPAQKELLGLLEREARSLVEDEGFAFPGFARLLSEVVGPYLETAREAEWDGGRQVRVAGAELFGGVEITDEAGSSREISFKADRVDGGPQLVITDYKTGRPLSEKKTAPARRRDLLEAVGAGARLQAAAYALAGGQPGDSGRYLFLRPDPEVSPEQRIASVSVDDREIIEAFLWAARAALDAWDSGSFLPRLIEPRGDREPRFCATCRVAEACLRGDSGARARLRDWIDARTSDPEGLDAQRPDPTPAERSLLRVWQLRPEQTRDAWKGRRR